MDKQALFTEIAEYLKSKGASKAAVFGSFARNEETHESDIDIIVDFKQPITLFDFAGYQIELQEKIGKKIDLIMEGGMNPLVEKYASKDYLILFQ